MSKKIVRGVFNYSHVVLLILVIIIFSLFTPNFLTLSNLLTVATNQAPFLLIIAMGMMMAILAHGIDLSIGSTLALSSAVAAFFLQSGRGIIGIPLAIIISLGIGAMNGVLITKIHLIPFIATYSMNLVVRGLCYLFTGGLQFFNFSDSFRNFAGGKILGISNAFWIAAVVFIAIWFLTTRTTFGRSLYGVGMNSEATALSGINANGVLIVVYALNGLLGGICGLMYASRLNGVDPTIGADFNLRMIAATLIGGTRFGGGRGSVVRTLFGVLIMMFLTNALNLNKVSSNWQDAMFGMVIVISLFIDLIGGKVMNSKKFATD